jgi:YHS domain-containing protein
MNRRRFATVAFGLQAFSAFAYGQTKTRPEKVTDPVCGIRVDKDPQLSSIYKGHTFYFCSNRDRETFRQNPAKYVK